MKLTASDRSSLIRMAHFLPKGSSERKAILAGLRVAARTTVRKESYSWGDIVFVEKGNQYKAILHSEDIKMIKGLQDGDYDMFKDEQGNRWTATRTGDTIRLKTRGMTLNFDLKDLQ